MTIRRTELRNAVLKLANSAGVECDICGTRGGHSVAILSFAGHTRKVFFGRSPSDRRTIRNVRRDIWRAFGELGVSRKSRLKASYSAQAGA
jgi:hypothetical protein